MFVEDGEREVYQEASEDFETEAYRTDMRGGVEIVYLEGETIISRLNKVFVFGWDFEILEDGVYDDDECWVRGRMTVWRKVSLRTTTFDPATNEIKIVSDAEVLQPVRREQYGSNKIKRSRATGKAMDIGFDKKGAATDALKKCASLLGPGLSLWNKEERATIKAMIEEAKQEEQQHRPVPPREQPNDSEPPRGREEPRRIDRMNRPTKPTGGQSGGSVINGIAMPPGFVQPFELMTKGKQNGQCRAEDCAEIIVSTHEYKIGAENRPGSYVIQRSHEMAGTLLCVLHCRVWKTALDGARAAS